MGRSELIRRLVLNAICDDYESLDQVIFRDVANDAAKLGFTVERANIVNALSELVTEGLAKAYRLGGPESVTELEGMPPLDDIEENFRTYFYITGKGRELHLSDDTWWPFKEQDQPG